MEHNPKSPKQTTKYKNSQGKTKTAPSASQSLMEGERDTDRVVRSIPRGRVEKTKKGKKNGS